MEVELLHQVSTAQGVVWQLSINIKGCGEKREEPVKKSAVTFFKQKIARIIICEMKEVDNLIDNRYSLVHENFITQSALLGSNKMVAFQSWETFNMLQRITYNLFHNIYQFMNYARFPPSFIEPVYHPDQFKKLDPEEIRELVHKNVKPPAINQSASVFHDQHLEKLVNYVMKGGRKAKAREIVQEVCKCKSHPEVFMERFLLKRNNQKTFGCLHILAFQQGAFKETAYVEHLKEQKYCVLVCYVARAFEKIKRTQIRKYHLAKDSSKSKIPTNPLEIFHQAVENCKPVLTTVSVKRGGVTYKASLSP
ncbi:28S ribosomal protein S7, mitochondrial [Frankliniella fusca]|uniref:28S ribosomal protein S7, mitochondrial n=1 Tax=Frankliniella fusca TaxID=407009 RepID=A0AAE1LSY1_9NEOP|nr:28S ribosomal protein S7, mitochondrial [Frankliniella fusca]